MSSTNWVELVAYASIHPFVVGTIARFEVTAPSYAFRVEASGLGWLFGHEIRYPRTPCGTTVAFRTNACARLGRRQELAKVFTASVPLKAPPEPGFRVSSARQGVIV